MKFHPLSELFPLMQGREFDELVSDIRANGLREPIWLYESQILDGRNRWRACEAVGIAPTLVEYEGSDPLAFVVSLNLHRRHLDESQRGLVAGKIATLGHGGDRVSEQAANLPVATQAEAAELLNVSERTVRSARRVIEDGAPELVEAVERGQVSVSAAADVSELPAEEQRELVARGEAEILAAARKLRRQKEILNKMRRDADTAKRAATLAPIAERFLLKNQPCLTATEIGSESVDWIITDPPYPREFLGVYDDLATVAEAVLKPGGSLLCMVGQSYLPEIIAALSRTLTYHWVIAYMTPGKQATQVFTRKITPFWKPVLWFTKGEYAGGWVSDVAKSDFDDNDKSLHHWGQSESGMRDLMRRFVRPADIVLDPFMGAGTTGVIALDLGATFYGFDIDAAAYNSTLVRLSQ